MTGLQHGDATGWGTLLFAGSTRQQEVFLPGQPAIFSNRNNPTNFTPRSSCA
ncbi:hypothetical protein CCM_01410 [Cordyceps militaris CM01]|uniref:Uncharacterized protein n=1 Tax=Cordyceps militaris (strain CM01) TaxID=983644 RepID=G3J4Y9_CORMM|nr:uncharacterized protein CCM_01410 [Cordyceps militaris CM01]EGX96752.1 hypothetical protein CCM_01410 [Cordyceps militaris CM01]